MKKLVVRGIKIFFLLFFSYINKNFSCECCDECWENFSTDKKTLSKYSGKNKKSDISSIIEEEQEEGEKGAEEEEEENKEENEEGNEEEKEKERIKKEEEKRKKKEEEEERKKKEEEENKKEEEERKEYLESLLENINNVKILKGDFFTEKEKIYERGRELGKGSFGSVYIIQKKNNWGKYFALKQIVVKDPNIETSIQKEIQNMIRLRNEKNIVKIFDVYKLEENSKFIFYIIMEFCENENLFKPIFRPNFVIKEKDKLAYQLIKAVRSCHKEKIAHRDLKPLNIFLDKDWNVKLGDFGLSDNFEYDGKDISICGSLNYMCYEKNRRLKHNPFKADLYSLGVILYELYTKQSYCDGEQKIIYKKGEEVWEGYKDDFYTNENVKDKLDEKLDDEKFKNLKILLTGLLQQLEGDRWGWDDIFDSDFYKELNEKYNNK